MSAIGGMLGLNGGAGGTGFSGPEQAGLIEGVNAGQAKTSYDQQQALLNALQGQNGIQNQSNVYNQLQGVANGTGPNPAQAMLNNATGQNIAAQNALMAGQRGASTNVGLMARQAGQLGGNIQQQAVGQGAQMQANQALNAIGAMGNIANNQVANQIGVTGAQQANVLNAIAQLNNAKVGSQSSVNSANASLAGGRMGQQGGAIGGVLGPIGLPMMNSMGQGMAGGGAGAAGGTSGIGPVASGAEYGAMLGAAHGGVMQSGPQSALGSFLAGGMSHGGEVPVALSPGEKVVAPQDVQKAAQGNVVAKTVPGKPKVSGDSLKNDTFKTKLPEGAVVVPRTKSQSDKDAASFVRNVLAKRGRK
jgi:hypothetical protein